MTDSSIEINGSTQLYALIGSPIRHSLSPLIHNTSFKLSGINAVFLAFDSLDLRGSLSGFKALGVAGFSVTVPHKVAVTGYLDEVSFEAKLIGSVNTVVQKRGKWIGYNTDVVGFTKSMEPFRKNIENEKVLVLGAGGSARAVIYALINNYDVGEIFIYNRTQERALRLISDFASIRPEIPLRFVSSDEWPKLGSKVIVNTTSVGLASEECLVEPDFFDSEMIVYDLIYDPIKTLFLQYAHVSGAVAINGLDMLVEQAAAAFYLWTERIMPIEIVKKNLLEKVDNQ
ncbi:shikimate dehydrogenase [bacterium]|nr:MAG: shikimate dehydrogenase [bacterium]